jgi:hypothetical protein
MSEHYERFVTDAAYRRKFLLLCLLWLALCAEVFLLWYDLPRHRQILLHTAVSVAVVLLPFTIMAVLARLPLGRRWVKSRFIIRPFATSTSKSDYDGSAIASLLHREIVDWRSASEGRIEGRGNEYSLPAASVSLGVTTLPLEWLWRQFLFLVTGKKDIIIEGLLLDSDQPFQLKIWVSDNAVTWLATLDGESFSESLAGAISKLTPDVLESVDPVKLAAIRRYRWIYDDAIRLMSMQDGSHENQLLIVETNLEATYLAEAERQLKPLKWRRRSSDDVELLRLRGLIEIGRGKFREARAILKAAAEHRKCKPNRVQELRRLLADSLAYEHNYTDAIEDYGSAQRQAIAELCRLTGEKSLNNLDDILGRPFFGATKDEVINALWGLREITINRSRCKRFVGQDGLEDLLQAQKADKILLSLGVVDFDRNAAATLAEIARQHLERQEMDAFQESIDDAIRRFEIAIEALQRSLKVAEDDFRGLNELAWAHFGKASCLRQKLDAAAASENASDNPLKSPVEKLTRIFRAMSSKRSKSFADQFRRARDLAATGGSKYYEHLQQAATKFLEGLLLDFDLAGLMGILRDLEALNLSDSKQTEAELRAKVPFPKLSPDAEEKAREIEMDSDDSIQLYQLTYRLLATLTAHANQQEMDLWLDTADWMVEADRSIEQCYQMMSDLERGPSRRHKAEALYGIACLYALDNNGAMAAKYLRAAGDVAGENTADYRNRAALDADLDPVRGDEEFQRAAAA